MECILKKGSRSREEEEELITEYVLCLLSECCGLKKEMPIHEEQIEITTIKAEKSWKKLLNNEVNFISNNRGTPELIFPGSFNPLHDGHIKMRELAEKENWHEGYI